MSESRTACPASWPATDSQAQGQCQESPGDFVCLDISRLSALSFQRDLRKFFQIISLFFYFIICFEYIHDDIVKVYIYYRIVFYFLNIDSISEDHISAFPPFEVRLLLH